MALNMNGSFVRSGLTSRYEWGANNWDGSGKFRFALTGKKRREVDRLV